MTPMHDVKTFLLTTVPSVPAFLAALEDKSTITILTAFVMPICFFVVSKTVDVIVQVYLKPWMERRRSGK